MYERNFQPDAIRAFTAQAASPNGSIEARAVFGRPTVTAADMPKRQKAEETSVAAARSWAAAEDTSDDDFG
jgi:hypothetical protein